MWRMNDKSWAIALVTCLLTAAVVSFVIVKICVEVFG